jgi:hypothetical protein
MADLCDHSAIFFVDLNIEADDLVRLAGDLNIKDVVFDVSVGW